MKEKWRNFDGAENQFVINANYLLTETLAEPNTVTNLNFDNKK